MPIQFPPSPTLNQEYTYEGKVWAWDGSSWVGVRQQTGILSSTIWAKQSLLIPKRGFGLNSGYNATTDQRRTRAGTIPMLKHGIERDLGLFGFSTGWTPAQITTALWLDAADASTITIATGVSQWNDKSGNARNATQATLSAQPSYVSGALNNLNVIRFDGSNDFLTHAFSSGSAPHTVFAIVNRRSGGFGDYQNIFAAVSPSSAFGINISAKASGISQWGSYINSWASGGSILSVGNAAIVGIVSPTSTSGTELYRTNGTQTAAISYASRYPGDGNDRRAIGGDPAFNTGWLSGDIAEVIAFTSALSTSNCQLIEGYLAHKWGLQANLPADHPYKNSAP